MININLIKIFFFFNILYIFRLRAILFLIKKIKNYPAERTRAYILYHLYSAVFHFECTFRRVWFLTSDSFRGGSQVKHNKTEFDAKSKISTSKITFFFKTEPYINLRLVL